MLQWCILQNQPPIVVSCRAPGIHVAHRLISFFIKPHIWLPAVPRSFVTESKVPRRLSSTKARQDGIFWRSKSI